MQRDQKIGLALGILLVGAVAAFFFRHEPAPDKPLPALQTAEALDHRIAEKDRTPYLQGPESPQTAAGDPFSGADPFHSDQPGGLVPDPIPLGNDPMDAASNSASLAARPQPAAATHHVVQRGETLSSIAAKYLGSAARFEEVYQANTDRLRDANDLRVGMELRIPGREVPVAPQMAVTPDDRRPVRDGTAVERPTPVPGADGDSNKKFQPYRGSPLTPKGTDPQSSGLDPKDAARRKLSQLPPRDDVSPPR
jgi:hypothetical protein